MTRIKSILAAGTLTGLVLLTMLALGFGKLSAQNDAAPTANNAVLVQPTTSNGAAAVQAWQDYSAQLESTVRTLQDRESQYQAQLEQANQAINQLQNNVNQVNSAPAFGGGFEHEEHEGFGDHDD